MGRKQSRAHSREITIVDVARRAQVALGTVSRVINRHPDVNPALREKVLVTCRELGFTPRVQHKAIVVVVSFNPAFPFGATSTIVAMMMQELAKRDYAMELISLD